MHEFAQSGLHGTPVDRIARSVGVAQPYVFSLFGSKRDLFLAAVDRCFERAEGMLAESARSYDPEALSLEDIDCLQWVGRSYVETMQTDPDLFMLQLQAFAACSDEVIRDHVRENFAGLVRWVRDARPGRRERVRRRLLALGDVAQRGGGDGGQLQVGHGVDRRRRTRRRPARRQRLESGAGYGARSG